jgi:hypothetical protein
MCLASSNLAPIGYCATAAGKEEIAIGLSDGGTSYYCAPTCSNPGGGAVAGQTGYSCYSNTLPDSGVVGIRWPAACAANTDCTYSTTYPACNTARGYCCTTATSTTCDSAF